MYPQTLCVWPWQRLQRWLRRIPGVWWVELWPLSPDGPLLKSSLFLALAFSNPHPSPSLCFSVQSTRHVEPTSSAVPMDAASSRVHGSVMEILTVMISRMKPQRTLAALAQVRYTQPYHKPSWKFIIKVFIFLWVNIGVKYMWLPLTTTFLCSLPWVFW